ncbi:MAG TPA: PKD domain-containing protein, partial [Acidobacteriota bacterium]|nr:PKD domain-containing protein [Acidobacteriota bacterium]
MYKKTRIVLWILLAGVLGGYVACNDDNGSQSNNNNSQPTITSISPATISIGQRNVEGQILGTNLTGVTGVSLGDGISLQSFNAVNASQINIVFSVDSSAASGARTIAVETSAGIASSSTLFQVTNNKAPRARFTMDPPSGSLDTLFTVDAKNSEDDDGTVASFRWDWGDGSTANGKKATHKFRQLGNYTVRLSVTDNHGAADSSGKEVEILRNSPPVPVFSISPSKGSTFTNFSFDGSRSYDPDGRVTKWIWDFGDGKRGNGEDVDHQYEQQGNYDVVLTVHDNKGQNSKLEKNVEVEKEQGRKCGGRGPSQTPYLFTVVSQDRARRTMIVQFDGDYGCAPYYTCGDVRKGGLRSGSPGTEHWVGVM